MTDDTPLEIPPPRRLPASVTTRAGLLTWGNGAILVLVAVLAVLIYAYRAGALHSDFDPLSDELARRAWLTEVGLGIAAVVFGIVAVVRRSGRVRGVIALVLGILVALVSFGLLSMTDTWESHAAPGRSQDWMPAHATCALVRNTSSFLFSRGTVVVCTGSPHRMYDCRDEYGAELGSGWFDPNSPGDCPAYGRYARAHGDLPALAAPRP